MVRRPDGLAHQRVDELFGQFVVFAQGAKQFGAAADGQGGHQRGPEVGPIWYPISLGDFRPASGPGTRVN